MTLPDRLRTETRSAHDRIERTVEVEACLSSVTAYRGLLARFYGIHAAWAAEAKALLANGPLLAGRSRTPLLVRDLRTLGASPEEIAALPLCPPLVPRRTMAEALGAMYVIEGSTLGGAVIAKQVERTLGLGANTGRAFFRSYGTDVGATWRAFRQRLLAFSSPETDDLVIGAANRTFEHLETWLAGAHAA